MNNGSISIIRRLVSVGVILSAACVSGFPQTQSREFVIRNIYIGLDADTRFVRRTADMIVTPYWIGKSNRSEVACMESQLNGTGLFQKVELELQMGEADAEFNLDLDLVYKDRRPTYRIAKIRLNSFPNADERIFNDRLKQRKKLNLFSGFPDFESDIKRALAIASGRSKEDAGETKVWIDLKRIAPGRVEVDVFPAFPKNRCKVQE